MAIKTRPSKQRFEPCVLVTRLKPLVRDYKCHQTLELTELKHVIVIAVILCNQIVKRRLRWLQFDGAVGDLKLFPIQDSIMIDIQLLECGTHLCRELRVMLVGLQQEVNGLK